MAYQSIKPGQIWLDTEGKPIQAHGASIYKENDVYYWIGENKEFTDGKNKKIWTWGIRMYASKDLYNWEDCGLIVEPDLKNKKSPQGAFEMALENRLKEHRARLGINQADMGKLAGVSRQTISLIESVGSVSWKGRHNVHTAAESAPNAHG